MSKSYKSPFASPLHGEVIRLGSPRVQRRSQISSRMIEVREELPRIHLGHPGAEVYREPGGKHVSQTWCSLDEEHWNEIPEEVIGDRGDGTTIVIPWKVSDLMDERGLSGCCRECLRKMFPENLGDPDMVAAMKVQWGTWEQIRAADHSGGIPRDWGHGFSGPQYPGIAGAQTRPYVPPQGDTWGWTPSGDWALIRLTSPSRRDR